MTAMLPTSSPGIEALKADPGAEERGVSLWRGAFTRLVRNPIAILGALLVLAFIAVALFAPLLAPYDPAKSQWIGQVTPAKVPGPSEGHPLGLDSLGSDMLTQLLFGARQSLIIGVVSTSIGLFFGAMIGLAAGAFGGWVDILLMRGVDILGTSRLSMG